MCLSNIIKLVFFTIFLVKTQAKPSNNDLLESNWAPSDADCDDPELYQDFGRFFADNEDCNSYFQCVHGKLIRNYCPKMNDTMGNQMFILHWDRMNNVIEVFFFVKNF